MVMELRRRVLGGKEMLDELRTSVGTSFQIKTRSKKLQCIQGGRAAGKSFEDR